MTMILGDCLEEMRKMDDNSIDFIVTDPPYGLKFMNKKWDHGIPGVEYWREALRICKPGSWMAAFGGTRTQHRLTCAIEDAGWEIRDCICWLYGSGFPKSHNKFGLEGFGTALKPAYEPIILAMKPIDGTYAQNVGKWRIGGININESRIAHNEICKPMKKHNEINSIIGQSGRFEDTTELKPNGRWPSNLILDEQSSDQLDLFTGIQFSKSGGRSGYNPGMWKGKKMILRGGYDDSGGVSRFFYCAKTSPSERAGSTHPTMKPISLMRYIIKLLAPPNDPVCLDPFAGSGTTLIAAQELRIRCIGIEKEKEYYGIYVERLNKCKLEV